MSKHLIDPFGRKIVYLRLSVTDKCNLRCFYCLPRGTKEFIAKQDWLTLPETVRVVRAFAELGIKRIRLTGGEPLVRKDLPELAKRIAATPGINDLSLSTNASLLARYASVLRAAGVARINVSLDSLRPKQFAKITGSPLAPVIDGLMAAKDAGFAPIKINMVAMKGVNDNEFEDMVEFCLQHNFILRLIETMPIGAISHQANDHFLDLQQVRRRLGMTFDLIPSMIPGGGPARYYQVQGSEVRIGFITPLSRHFCASCNRIRLASNGTLYLCLGQNHKFELRTLLRRGISDLELKNTLVKALALKPECHEFETNPHQVVRLMSSLGG